MGHNFPCIDPGVVYSGICIMNTIPLCIASHPILVSMSGMGLRPGAMLGVDDGPLMYFRLLGGLMGGDV